MLKYEKIKTYLKMHDLACASKHFMGVSNRLAWEGQPSFQKEVRWKGAKPPCKFSFKGNHLNYWVLKPIPSKESLLESLQMALQRKKRLSEADSAGAGFLRVTSHKAPRRDLVFHLLKDCRYAKPNAPSMCKKTANYHRILKPPYNSL